MARREFTRDQKAQITARATDALGVIRCERCSLAQKSGSFEIDHVIAEGMRPEADKKARITIAEGQLLGKSCCHRGEHGKTNDDVAKIAKAKRREAKHTGITRPAGHLQGQGFPRTDKAAARAEKAAGKAMPPRKSLFWTPGHSTGEGT